MGTVAAILGRDDDDDLRDEVVGDRGYKVVEPPDLR
jgi:hypothetical protein